MSSNHLDFVLVNSAELNGFDTNHPVSNADGTLIDQYWEDGPEFSGWGEVVSKYPDGTRQQCRVAMAQDG